MNINELLNKANEVIAEANEEVKEEVVVEEVKEEVVIELMEDSSNNDERQQELLNRVNDKIELIKNLEGIKINKMGIWLWVEGNTTEVKEELKSAGFKYASKKKMWYYNPDEFYQKKSKWTASKKKIIELYGIEEIK